MNAKRQAAIAKIRPLTDEEIVAGLAKNAEALRKSNLRTEECERHIAALEIRLRELEREADARRKA